MVSVEKKILKQLTPKLAPVGDSGFILPNHSGEHDKGIRRTLPTESMDLVNKAYVDSVVAGLSVVDDGANYDIQYGGVTLFSIRKADKQLLLAAGVTTDQAL